jgi:tRNA(Ile)-lysidine synthase
MLGSDCRNALVRGGVTQGRMLVAVSGGRDSVALLALLREAAPALGLELVVGHVNHRLRGEASDADEIFVKALAKRAGFDFRVRHIDPETLRTDRSSRSRPTLEEAARDLRREALVEIADEIEAGWIATAHHAGDQAETVLLRILRGTGPEGLAAMAPVSPDGRWVRPLLDVDPGALAAFALEAGLEWVEDESNQDQRFARNRLRLNEIPRLTEDFNPQLLRTLCNLAEAQRRDLEWIEALVDEAARGRIELGKQVIQLSFEGWNELPEALGRRLARRSLLAVGLDRDVTRSHIERVLAFLRRGRSVGRDKILELPCGIWLRRGDAGFELGPIPAEKGD